MRRPSRQGQSAVCALASALIAAASSSAETGQPSALVSAFFIRSGSVAICILFLLIGRPARGQDNDIAAAYFSAIRMRQTPAADGDALIRQLSPYTLEMLTPYLSDSVPGVRAAACEIAHRAALASADTAIRRNTVRALLSQIKGKEQHNGRILRLLRSYPRTDFDPPARAMVSALIHNETQPFTDVLRLAGFLNMPAMVDDIRPWSQPGNPPHVRWAAWLSLSRMGDVHATGEIMKRVTRLGVNDNVVYDIFPDLIYTRNKEALDYIVVALADDEKRCLSAEAERQERIVCGYRIMEQLAPVVDGFPVALDESGDLLTDNYPLALEQVRTWFSTHTAYRIRNEHY